LYCISE